MFGLGAFCELAWCELPGVNDAPPVRANFQFSATPARFEFVASAEKFEFQANPARFEFIASEDN